MLPLISLAVSLPFKPLHDPKRRGNLVCSFFICSALRGNTVSFPGTDTSPAVSLSQSHLDSLYEVYESSRKSRPLAPTEIRARADVFLSWGLSFEELHRCVSTYPQFLSRRPVELRSLFEAFLLLGFVKSQVKEMLLRYPQIVRVTEQHLMVVSQYFVETLGMEEKQFEQVVMKWPRILMYRLKESLIPTNDFFLNEVGMEKERLYKMLMRFPQVSGCSVERKMKPLVHYFHDVIGVPKSVFSKRISDQPTVLGLSLKKIKERVKWLKKNLSLSNEDVCRVCSLTLSAFQLTLPTLEAKIDNICKQFKINRRQCGSLLTHYPQILTLSIKNVNETIRYLVEVAQRDVEEVESCPRILWCSLDDRIRPRYERMMSLDFPCVDYKIVTLFGTRDDDFEKLLERHAQNAIGGGASSS